MMTDASPQRLTSNLLFVAPAATPFIQDDLELFRRTMHVTACIGSGVGTALRIISTVGPHDIVFCWFASVYAALAVAVGHALGVRTVVVIGGVDVAADEELGYGIWRSGWKSVLLRYALRRADVLLPVDPSLAADLERLVRYEGENITCVPTGYDSTFWRPAGEKQKRVLAVAAAETEPRMRVKGIDLFFEAARLLPDIPFVLVGTDASLLKHLNPPANVSIHPHVQRRELLPWYRSSLVYCQPSRREGLPNSLCEAMLCECVPVVSCVGGNMSAAGDTGIGVPPNDPVALAGGITRAFELPADAGRAARTRIVALFPREKRERELLRIVSDLLGSGMQRNRKQ